MSNENYSRLNSIAPCPLGTSAVARKDKDIKDKYIKDKGIKNNDIKNNDVKNKDVKNKDIKNKDIKEQNIKYDVSVIIPCYNVEKYVSECIESVLSTITDYKIQIIIVDDGSTDNTPRIIEQYRDHKNIKIITTVNQGVAAARNIGIDESEGRYLLFLDSDDYLINNGLHILLDEAGKLEDINTKVDAIEGRITSDVTQAGKSVGVKRTNSLIQGYMCGVLFNRRCFDTVRFPEGFWYEDTIWGLRLLTIAESTYMLDIPVYYYRQNTGSVTTTSVGQIRTVETFWIMKRLLEDRDNLGEVNDKQIAEIVLSQIALNYVRVSSLDESIRRLVFDCTCDLWKEIFPDVSSGMNLARTSLISCLRTGNYDLYEIVAQMLWEESLHRGRDMNVAIAITSNYVYFAYVMLSSVFENNRNRNINAYILYNDIEDEKLKLFEELERNYCQTICCQKIPNEWIPEELPVNQYWPKEIYFRCYLSAIIPDDQDRVLYLDTDIIVNKSLDYLYDASFMGNSLAACMDQSVQKTGLTDKQAELFSQLPEFSLDRYFNSGVVLFNLNKIREKITVEEILSAAVELKDCIFAPDQDLLNLLFYKDVLYENDELYNMFARQQFNEGRDYRYMKDNAVIIHYAGRKPWTGEAIRYNTERLWWEYAENLPSEEYIDLMKKFILEEIDSNFANDAIKGLLEKR